MTILSKLSYSDKTRAAMLTSPEVNLRGKMLEGLDLQIEAAKAMLNGETFIRRAMRWVDDPETGERVRKEVPVRFRTWYWKDEQGDYMLDVRYGNKRLEIKPKKPAVEVGDGTVATADKQHLLDCYSGIAFNLTTLISIALRVVRDHTGYLYQATERTDYLLRSTDRSGP